MAIYATVMGFKPEYKKDKWFVNQLMGKKFPIKVKVIETNYPGNGGIRILLPFDNQCWDCNYFTFKKTLK